MKKTFFFFILAASVALVSCNNKPAENTEATTTVDTAAVPAESAATSNDSTVEEGQTGETGDNGTSSMPANVFENSSGKPLAGASVQAKAGNTVVETVTTDANGNYQFTQLQAGVNYTFRATKQGYAAQTKTASFSGSNSLPWFGMQ